MVRSNPRCRWEGQYTELHQHFTKHHSKIITIINAEDGEIVSWENYQKNCDNGSSFNMLITAFGELFFFSAEVNK